MFVVRGWGGEGPVPTANGTNKKKQPLIKWPILICCGVTCDHRNRKQLMKVESFTRPELDAQTFVFDHPAEHDDEVGGKEDGAEEDVAEEADEEEHEDGAEEENKGGR